MLTDEEPSSGGHEERRLTVPTGPCPSSAERRRNLGSGGLLAALRILTASAAVSVHALASSGALASAVRPHAQDALSRLEQTRDVVVTWRDVPLSRAYHGGRFEALPANRAGRERGVALLEGEVELYPRGLVRKMRLLRVELVEWLKRGGDRCGGLYDPETWTVYLDASLFDSWEPAGRRSLHHEVFHSLDDWSLRGAVGEREWDNLNEARFQYTPDDRSLCWTPFALLPYRGRRGFLTRYAMSSGVEDRAEVFSFLIAHPDLLEERTREDPVLWRKAEVLRRFLRGLCEEVDERYWSDLKRRRAGASRPRPWRDVPNLPSLRTASREAIPNRTG